jgi:outer membrane protein assembly factor BamB
MRRLSIATGHRGTMLRAAAAVLLLTAFLAPATQGEWPSFHNDARHTGFVPGSTYPVFVDVWWNNKTPENAQVKASPVLKDNILITASLGSPLASPANNGLVRALDAASGTELWRYKMAAPIESTPAISGERVYVVDTSGNLKALNLRSGGVEHSATVGQTLGHITLNEGKLFIGTEAGEVKAYLSSTLTLLWTFNVNEGYKVVTSYSNSTGYQCGSPPSSAPLQAPTSQPVRGAPTVFQGKVFFGSLNHWVFAVDEQGTGNLKTTAEWAYKTGDVVLATAAINNRAGADPRVVFSSYDGKVYSFPTTVSEQPCGTLNTPAWTYEVPSIVDSDTGEKQVSKVHSSPAAAGDKIFFGANNGKMYGVRADNGALIWETTAGNVLQPVTGSPAVANGKVVVGSEDKNVYWINATDGKILKKFATQSAIDTSPAIEGDRAFVAARDGTLYMFGPEIPRRADLQVTAVQAVGSSLQVTVKNAGDAAASGNTSVRLLVGGTFLANVAVPKLNASETVTVTSSTPVPGTGSVQVQAIVDPDNTIVESNDSNNELSQGVSLVPPVPDDPPEDDDGGGGFKIPAPGLVPTLALLGLAALAMRKRR